MGYRLPNCICCGPAPPPSTTVSTTVSTTTSSSNCCDTPTKSPLTATVQSDDCVAIDGDVITLTHGVSPTQTSGAWTGTAASGCAEDQLWTLLMACDCTVPAIEQVPCVFYTLTVTLAPATGTNSECVTLESVCVDSSTCDCSPLTLTFIFQTDNDCDCCGVTGINFTITVTL